MQTDPDFEQIIINDDKGRGLWWANKQIANLGEKLNGDYIYILDDDDFIICETFIEELKEVIKQNNQPAMIFVKGWIHEKEMPEFWPSIILRGCMGAPNFITRRDVFDKYCHHWNHDRAGDFHFLKHAATKTSNCFPWDRFIFYADPSSGKTELEKNVIREKVYY